MPKHTAFGILPKMGKDGLEAELRGICLKTSSNFIKLCYPSQSQSQWVSFSSKLEVVRGFAMFFLDMISVAGSSVSLSSYFGVFCCRSDGG